MTAGYNNALRMASEDYAKATAPGEGPMDVAMRTALAAAFRDGAAWERGGSRGDGTK